MKNKHMIPNVLYYILVPLVYFLFLSAASLFLGPPQEDDLGIVADSIYAVLYVLMGTPIITIILMRFSLLKWYVDPFAALEIPAVIYILVFFNYKDKYDSLPIAFEKANDLLVFLLFVFIFALAASLSFERKEENSISYKLISKISR